MPPDTASPVGTDVVLRALADPHRREIVRLVRDTELPAGQIAMHFTLTQQAVSQHLTVLKRAGLLEERREGTRRLYRFQPASLEPVRDDARRVLAGRAGPPQACGRTRSSEAGSAGLVTEPVTAIVRIAAPPAVVFPYFTDPALAVKWIADAAYLDARPGGTFSVDVQGNPARGRVRRDRPAPSRRLHVGHRGAGRLPTGQQYRPGRPCRRTVTRPS